MTERRLALSLAFGLLVSASASVASANESGLAGYSGKPNAANPNGQSCNQCHSGGTAPQVVINGPASLNAGQKAEYDVVVTTGQSRASAAVAATDGVVLTNIANFRESFGEMVPPGNSVAASGTATFKLQVTAPATGNSIELWAVGLACNGSGTGGDKATHTTKTVTIVGGAPAPAPTGTGTGGTPTTPPPGSSSGSDAGAGTGSPGTGTPATGSPGSTNTGKTSNSAAPSGEDESESGGTTPGGRPLGGGANQAACAVTRVGGDEGSTAGAFAALAVSAALLLGARSRRRSS